MNKLVSVIIPVYNVESYLDKCTNSVVGQSYKELEVILVDDGSPDNCPQMCDEWAKKDERVKVIHKQNGGLSDARNAGIEISNGNYITFLDSDDFIPANYIETLVNGIESTGADISACGIEMIIGEFRPILSTKDSVFKWSHSDAIAKMFYSDEFEVSACAKLYKNNLFKNICYPKGKLFEDMATTYKLFDKASIVSYCEGTKYYYFKRPDSITTRKFSLGKMYLIEVMQQIISHYDNHDEIILKSVYCRYLNCNIELFIEIDEEFENEKNILWKNICYYRNKVLFNSSTPFKIRIKCCITYLGSKLGHKVLRKLIYNDFNIGACS